MKQLSYYLSTLAFTTALSSTEVESANALMRDYTPLLKADTSRPLKLQTIKDIGLRQGKVLDISGIEVKLSDDDDPNIQLSGIDANRKPWKLTKHYYGLGTALFVADLDNNGVKDIVLLQSTGACGIAPPAVLTSLMFDKEKRPMPFEVSGYFGTTDEHWDENRPVAFIDDLIRIGNDKHAILVCNQLDSAEVKGRNRSYWRTILYRADNGLWQRVSNYREKRLPMLVRYTYKPNHQVIPPAVPALAKYDDGGYDKRRVKSGTISKFELDENNNVKSLVIDPDKFSNPLQWSFFSPFIIKDTLGGREIFGLSTRSGKELLREAGSRKRNARYLSPTVTQLFPMYIWLED
ncbi:MAG: hypothetical protein K2X93_16855 [Candidatus Obscuribacterales bacterium]|nr:hypothetical protein [Candidatus Obscuribacterales bacterium]